MLWSSAQNCGSIESLFYGDVAEALVTDNQSISITFSVLTH